MTVTEIFQAGRDRLVERGFCKNALVDDEGRVCAMGAIADATPEHKMGHPRLWGEAEVWSRADKILCEFAPRVSGNWWSDIVAYNNHPDTTINDVLQVFDDAILAAKERDL